MNSRLRYEYELGEIHHVGTVGVPKGVTVVFGGQAGSEGKGAIAGWLAWKYEWGAACSTFMPNAGHTWVSPDGDEVVVTQLPIGLVSPMVGSLVLGASSIIDVEKFFEEINKYDEEYNVASRISIHPRAHVMLQEYRDWEADNLRYIASTGKGCGAALGAKARREQGVVLAKDHPRLQQFVRHDMDRWLNDLVNSGAGILAEQSQGFDLDINHGHSYPYCTSRQCTPSQICADLCLDARLVRNSIAVVRTFPIRVGNVEGGTSGEYGSQELSWDDISSHTGRSVQEITTVTRRVRRVFRFDWDRIAHMSAVCRPTHIALTFADYVDGDIYGVTATEFAEKHLHGIRNLSEPMSRFIYKVQQAVARSTYRPKVKIMKTGPRDDQTLDLGLIL